MDRLEALGHAIRDARRRRGFTQEQLAEMCGLHTNSISLFERAVHQPSLKVLFSIADALNICASELLERAEELAASR